MSTLIRVLRHHRLIHRLSCRIYVLPWMNGSPLVMWLLVRSLIIPRKIPEALIVPEALCVPLEINIPVLPLIPLLVEIHFLTRIIWAINHLLGRVYFRGRAIFHLIGHATDNPFLIGDA